MEIKAIEFIKFLEEIIPMIIVSFLNFYTKLKYNFNLILKN